MFRWKSHKHGEIRRVNRFAWLPTHMPDGTVIWLGWYSTIEKFYIFHVDGGNWHVERRFLPEDDGT